MGTFVRGAVVAGLAVAAAVAAAEATSIRRMEIGEIARRADLVLIGTVEGNRTRLASAPGNRTRIFTDYELGDVSTWKGSVPTSNHVASFVGGSLHGRTLGVEGVPVLEEGKRYLLFLGEKEPLCPVIGWDQGIFILVDGPDGRILVRRKDGSPVSSAAGGTISSSGPSMELGAFLADLERAGARETPR